MLFEALLQEVMEYTHRMEERCHAGGLECDRSPFNVGANVPHQLVKATQAFSGQKSNHGIRFLFSMARMDQFAHVPGSQTDVVHRMAKFMQRGSVRGGFHLGPLCPEPPLRRPVLSVG